MEIDEAATESESSSWSAYFRDSFKPACYESTWELGLDALPLHAAVLNDDIDAAEGLLSSKDFPVHEHIDTINRHTNGAPIHEAIRRGDYIMVQLLLDYGAFVHRRAPDEDEELSVPALTIAVELGNVDIVRALLDAHADPVVTDRRTLSIAAERGHAAVVDALLQWSRANRVTLDKDDALELAAREWHANTTRLLLNDEVPNQGALNDALIAVVDSKLWGKSNVIPFCFRFEADYRKRQFAVVEMLLDAGADANHQCRCPTRGQEPEHRKDFTDGCRDITGATPLQKAVSATGSAGVVELLLERGANVHQEDDFEKTPLFYAALSNDIEIFNILLEWGADVRKQDIELYTPLHMAARYSDAPIVNLLIERGADPCAANVNYETPLHSAAHGIVEENIQVLRRLLQLGADINARTAAGSTPLILAAVGKHRLKCMYLLANGADVNAITKINRTALERAIHYGAHDIANILLQRRADIQLLDQPAAIRRAFELPNPVPMLDVLLQHGVDINIRDSEGATPLINLVKRRAYQHNWKIDDNVIQSLILRGADVYAVDNNSWTVKDWATKVGYEFNWNFVWEAVDGTSLGLIDWELDSGVDFYLMGG